MTTEIWAQAEAAYRQEKLQHYARRRTEKQARPAGSGWLTRHRRRQDGQRGQTLGVAGRA
jgi:hypothetical protein